MDSVTYRFYYGSPIVETAWLEMPAGVPLGALIMMGRQGRSLLSPPLVRIECCFGNRIVLLWDGIDISPWWLRALSRLRVWCIKWQCGRRRRQRLTIQELRTRRQRT